ncbi:DUF6516 family protein [Dehalococcoidia bacterium]|nr:DUF6516 family protein [Dehalococcoidia bacterium]
MIYGELSHIAEDEFPDLVLHYQILPGKLRLYIVDGSYLDIWFSRKFEGRFAYHWERRIVDGRIYRYDNRSHEELKHMRGFPKHFHDGSDEKISESQFSEDPKEVLREFLQIARKELANRVNPSDSANPSNAPEDRNNERRKGNDR